ncbi:glycosyltransferase family 2 protein [Agromyces ramosus]|uniref:glycosyltransferase family 2 protein n=1 Tax=Agromyces ramosus TaxID=33879 RepID=UPI0024151238|nr:glycosyltransferase family 2 protein [Agromyces ramosus]
MVAFNRRDLLHESLTAVLNQTRAPDRVIVVDNASSDGTDSMVAQDFPSVELVRLGTNSGGAGGFAVGLSLAVAAGADHIWLMDDDTVPTTTALQESLRALRAVADEADLIASRVVWSDGRDHPMNMPRVRPFAPGRDHAAARAFGGYPVRSASFVSVLVAAEAVRRVGLPIADYFLWNDDFEYTSRILRAGRGYLARGSLVVHKTAVFGSTDVDPGPRFRLEVRNKIWMLAKSHALAPHERLVYSASTLRRWARTFARSADRRRLTANLGRGLVEGFRGRPRGNAEALAVVGIDITGIANLEAAVADRRSRALR